MLRIAVAGLTVVLLTSVARPEPMRDTRPVLRSPVRYDAALSRHDSIFARPEDARGLGVMAIGTKRPRLFMTNEIIFQAKNNEDLARFLAATRGRLVEETLPPDLPRLRNESVRAAFEQRHRLIRFEAASFDLASIRALGPRVGITETVRFKDEASARTVAAVLALASKGFRVELNAVGTPQQALFTRTREANGADAFKAPGLRSGAAGGVSLSEISRAWQLMFAAGITNKVRLAIIDSGFWIYAGTATPGDAQGRADFPSIAFVWNAIADNNDASGENVMECGGNPCQWHGYQAASVAAALPDNNAGVAGSGGFVAMPMFIRVGGTAHNHVYGAWLAFLQDAKVINMSLSWDCSVACDLAVLIDDDPRSSLQHAVATFEQHGTVVVASAGNDGIDVVDNHIYPCRAVTICVGATDGAPNLPASFSNYGASVTLWAPTNIDSLYPNNGIKSFGGTSASAPFVAGVVAMMQAVDPAASVATIRSALLDSANSQPASAGGGKVERWLNAYEAVYRMLNWRIRDDDTEVRGRLPLALGHTILNGRTLNKSTDIDEYAIDVADYSTFSVSMDYMQQLNGASLQVSREEAFKDHFEPEGVTAASPDNRKEWSADLVPPGRYTIRVSGLGPNLYDLATTVNAVGLKPDEFDRAAAVGRGGVGLPGGMRANNDSPGTAATLKQSTLYFLTLHKPDGSDVDYFRMAGGDKMMAGFQSERPFNVEVLDSAGNPVGSRIGVTSAVFSLPLTSSYLVKVSGPLATRYFAGVEKFNPRPPLLRMRYVPRPFDPGDPAPIMLPPGSEHVYLIPRAKIPTGPIQVNAPGVLELVSAADNRVLATSAPDRAGNAGSRSLQIPPGLPQRDYYLRVSRDDAGRDVAMQSFAILSLRTKVPNMTNVVQRRIR